MCISLAMSDMVCNELLCFVRKRFGSVPHLQMCRLLCGFYSEAEVSGAKALMISESRKNLKSDNIQRFMVERVSLSRRTKLRTYWSYLHGLIKRRRYFHDFLGKIWTEFLKLSLMTLT